MRRLTTIALATTLLTFPLVGCAVQQNAGTASTTSEATTQQAAEEGDLQFILYVGTNDKDTNKPVCTPAQAKEKAKAILINSLGGYTIQEAEGGWIGDDGTEYQEYTMVIYLSDTTEEQAHKVAEELRQEFNQSSILINTTRVTSEFYDGSDATASTEAAAEVVPVTWDVTPEHPMIDTDEARALYKQIKAGDYPSMEELESNPVVAQLDALSAYYKDLYGNTADIDTPERKQMRKELKEWFLKLGSARTESVDDNGKHHYVYDGPVKKDYQMELVLGLPASGKSTMVTDPDSEEMGAFIMDCDVIKAELPEYKESHGAAADAVHFEGYNLMQEAMKEFFKGGSMQGTNVIIPIVSSDLDDLMENLIKPFEEAGYHVKVKFCPAKPNEAAARVVMRELGGGQLINSKVAFGYGYGPEEVYNKLSTMLNSDGEPYGVDVEALDQAA